MFSEITTEIDFFKLFETEPHYHQDLNQLKQRWYQLQRHYHPDRHVEADSESRNQSSNMAALINTAYQTLLDPLERAIYLLKYFGITFDPERNTELPQEFLIEQMDLRERLQAGEAILKEVIQALEVCEKEFVDAIKMPQNFEKAQLAVRKMMFYSKLAKSEATHGRT